MSPQRKAVLNGPLSPFTHCHLLSMHEPTSFCFILVTRLTMGQTHQLGGQCSMTATARGPRVRSGKDRLLLPI